MNRPALRILVPMAAYAALVLALCWPLPARLDSEVLGQPRHPGFMGDLFFQANMQRQMRAGHLPDLTHTSMLGHPDGLDLDSRVTLSLHLWLYAAAMTVFDLLPARNLVGMALLLFNALCMHLLARRRWGREDLAYLCGLLFALSPYIFIKVHQGFVQKTFLGFVPLFFLFLFEVLQRDKPRLRHQIGLLLSLAGALWVYPPYGICNLGAALPLSLADLIRRRPSPAHALRRHGPLWIGAAVMLAAIYAFIADDPRTAPGPLPPLEHLGGYLNGLNPFLFHPYGAAFDFVGLPELQRLSVGFPVVITLLALFAAVRGLPGARLWVALCLAMLVVMLGPYAPRWEQLPEPERVRLPFYYLCRLPLVGSLLYFPVRLAPWVLLGLLLCAGDALVHLQGRLTERFDTASGRRAASYLVVAVLVLSVAEHRLLFAHQLRYPVQPLPTGDFVKQARNHHHRALYLLPPRPVVPNAFLYLAVVTHKNLVNGYIKRPGPLPFPGADATPAEQRRFVDGLRARDVGFVVLLLDQLPDRDQRHTTASPYPRLDRQLGRPAHHADENLLAYRVSQKTQ